MSDHDVPIIDSPATDSPATDSPVIPIKGNGGQAPILAPADRLAHVRELWGEAIGLETRIGAETIGYLARRNALVAKHTAAFEAYQVALRRLQRGCGAAPGTVLDLATGEFRQPGAA